VSSLVVVATCGFVNTLRIERQNRLALTPEKMSGTDRAPDPSHLVYDV
jgi:hypothetical protein